jgi:hypothetical protein
MPIRYNYTNRNPIEQQNVDIQLVFGGEHVSFIPKVNFGNYEYPSTAHAYIEVFRKSQLVRFDFGPMSAPHLLATPNLDEFGEPMGLLFRVKVIDPVTKDILALSKPVRAGNDPGGSADSILPLARLPEDCNLLWKLDFEDGPVLYINKNLDTQVTRKDYFIALVYPEVMRQVLSYAFLYHFGEDYEWAEKWKRFACEIRHAPPFPNIPENPEHKLNEDQIDEIQKWIDAAVEVSVTDKHLAEKANNWG